MKVDLLPHNQEAYEKIKPEIAEGKKRIAIAHATGTGKSYLIAKLFEDYSNDKKLVLVPSTYISDQIKELFEKYSIQNRDVMLYQKLIRLKDEDITAMNYDVIALDEYHHDTSKVWGGKVRTLIDTHPESIIFGTSATPVRSDGVNTIDELFEGNCASNLPLSESIAKKIVPLPKYVGALYALDDELEKLQKKVDQATNTKEEKQELYKKINAMRKQIEKSYGMPIILNKNIKDREGKYIVFCKNKKHLADIKETVIEWFKTAGFKDIHTYEVYSNYEKKNAEYKAFCNDTSHSLKLMFCVDMLNEGLHLENISGVLLLRPTRSSIVWHQQIGRAIEANNTNAPVIIDAVNNFSSVGQGMELLKEIKNAIAKEKESDPNFDDSGLEDIDTFFVLEQMIEIQDMFREIEERLEGNWDLYIRALTQYKEREGDCDVPGDHIEIVDGVDVKLGQWCMNVRRPKTKIIPQKRNQLNKLGFIWNTYEYTFENNVKDIAEYYKKYGKYPSSYSSGKEIKKMAYFVTRIKSDVRKGECSDKELNVLEKYLPDFSCETVSDKSFNEFIYYARLYKEKYGHLNIKYKDTIEGYPIGLRQRKYRTKQFKKRNIDKFKILEDLGMNFMNKQDKQFINKMELAKQAVKNGITISFSNPCYCGENLFNWIRYTVKKKYLKKQLLDKEKRTLENLIGRTLENFYCCNSVPVKVFDMVENKKVGIFNSQIDTVKAIQEKFNIKITAPSIRDRLIGKTTTPYKGRFMFYRVDENGEVTE